MVNVAGDRRQHGAADGSEDTRLVLASTSPRRRELVRGLARAVEAVAPGGEETAPRSGEAPERYVTRLALAKARGVALQGGNAIVIGADTAVVLAGEVLGKPSDAREATAMLQRLRGRTHRVVTGVAAVHTGTGRDRTSATSSEVRMRPYSDGEVAAYVASGDPLDKAGGYAVQDTSFRPAEAVVGCYLNVVGLPLCEVTAALEELGGPTQLRAGWAPPEECDDCALRPSEEAADR